MMEIRNLGVSVEGKEIVKSLSLIIEEGKTLALMGPNGSGKSTLAYALMGHPKYVVTGGSVALDGKDLLSVEPDERSRAGLFLSFQHPASVPGVSLSSALRQSVLSHGHKMSLPVFRKKLAEEMRKLGIPEEFMDRPLNEGFSGGEKKRVEILQLRLLKPKVAILDETDSGLDIDAIRLVSEGVRETLKENPSMSVLVITHYQRILDYLQPDEVHVMSAGSIVRSGGPDLVHELEEKGYGWITESL